MDIMKILDVVVKVITSEKFYVPLFTFIAAKLAAAATKKIVEKLFLKKGASSLEQKRKNTIISLAQNVTKYFIWGMALIIILSAWGFDVTGVITGLGVVGVVAGLALQDALKDIIAGANIILDNFYVIGDKISINGFTGDVIEFSLKTTKIRNADGEVLIIANREVSSVKNLSIKTASIAITIPVAYEEKSDKVVKTLEKICEDINGWDVTTKNTDFLGVDALGASSVDYMIRAYCKPGDQWGLKRKMLAYVKDTFDEKGIKIPYNQIEVHNG